MHGRDEYGISCIDYFLTLFHITLFVPARRRAVKPRFGAARLHNIKARLLEFCLQHAGNLEVYIALLYARRFTNHSSVHTAVSRIDHDGKTKMIAGSHTECNKTNPERDDKRKYNAKKSENYTVSVKKSHTLFYEGGTTDIPVQTERIFDIL